LGDKACQTWLEPHEEYSKYLGKPVGPAVVKNDTWPKGPGSGYANKDRCAKDGNADLNLKCQIYQREFESGTKVFVGQFLDPNCTVTRCSGPIGACVYWADGNITGASRYCPPKSELY
jgi:hypothetical protein